MTKSWWQFHVWYYANEGSDQYHTTHIGIMSVCTEFWKKPKKQKSKKKFSKGPDVLGDTDPVLSGGTGLVPSILLGLHDPHTDKILNQ